MSPSILLAVLLGLSSVAYILGRRRAFAVAGTPGKVKELHSRPTYYGALAAIWCSIPALILFGFWLAFEQSVITNLVVADLPDNFSSLPPDRLNLVINDIKNFVSGNIVSGRIDASMQMAADHYRHLVTVSHGALAVVVLALATAATLIVRVKITPKLRARNHVEKITTVILIGCSTVAIFTTIGIVLSVLYEAIRFFGQISIWEFLFGLKWSPQMAIRADQVGSSGAFGSVPVFVGTLLISAIAMIVAVPIGLMSAIYLSEYAHPQFRSAVKPLLEILAGIPTVVYGFFAALVVAPLIRNSGDAYRSRRVLRKRPGGGPGHGHHDHPLRLLDFGRRHQCRAPGDARRRLQPRRHPIRNHQTGGHPRGAARHRRAVSCWPSPGPSVKP